MDRPPNPTAGSVALIVSAAAKRQSRFTAAFPPCHRQCNVSKRPTRNNRSRVVYVGHLDPAPDSCPLGEKRCEACKALGWFEQQKLHHQAQADHDNLPVAPQTGNSPEGRLISTFLTGSGWLSSPPQRRVYCPASIPLRCMFFAAVHTQTGSMSTPTFRAKACDER